MQEGNVDRVVLRTAGLGRQVTSPEGPLTILDDINLAIRAGESVALVGPSGAGKTTLLALLAGLDQPSAGQVWLCGEEITALDEDGRARLRGKRVGFVFQSFHLLPSLTALENVMLPMEFSGVPASERRKRAGVLLERVGLDKRLAHLPRELSGGEQQRVAIARALANDPPLVLADEPTGNLDSKTGQLIYELLKEIARERTVVVVTHAEVLAQMADRVVHIKDGRLVPGS